MQDNKHDPSQTGVSWNSGTHTQNAASQQTKQSEQDQGKVADKNGTKPPGSPNALVDNDASIGNSQKIYLDTQSQSKSQELLAQAQNNMQSVESSNKAPEKKNSP